MQKSYKRPDPKQPKIISFQMMAIPTQGISGQANISLVVAGLGEDGQMYKWEVNKWVPLR